MIMITTTLSSTKIVVTIAFMHLQFNIWRVCPLLQYRQPWQPWELLYQSNQAINFYLYTWHLGVHTVLVRMCTCVSKWYMDKDQTTTSGTMSMRGRRSSAMSMRDCQSSATVPEYSSCFIFMLLKSVVLGFLHVPSGKSVSRFRYVRQLQ